jgi:nucleotide-binding universal stress UspA family protein
MIKTILVPTSGSASDEGVFMTALALARPLSAHLHFVHVELSPGVAASYAPHVDFLQGAALRVALGDLAHEAAGRAAEAREHFTAFCRVHGLPVNDSPQRLDEPSASWQHETDQPFERLLLHARH